jgi:hypothetical protein
LTLLLIQIVALHHILDRGRVSQLGGARPTLEALLLS